MSIKKILKKPYILLTIFVIAISVVWLLVRELGTAQLSVTTFPQNAIIYLNGNEVAQGNYGTRLAKGEYLVKVESVNYVSETETIELTEDRVLDIKLVRVAKENEPVSGVFDNVDKFEFSAGTIDAQQNLIGSNDFFQIVQLVNDELVVIYQNPIYAYSFTDPLISILNQDDFQNVFIYNIKDQTLRRVPLAEYSQVIATAISKDLQTLYFIGDYDFANRTAALYATSINNIAPRKIADLVALNLQAINSDFLAVYLPSEEQDLGVLKIININTGGSALTLNSNTYSVSPSGEYIYSQNSREISIIAVDNQQVNTLAGVSLDAKLTWKGDNTLVVVEKSPRDEEAVVIRYIDPKTNFVTKTAIVELPTGVGIRFLWGASGNKVFATDSLGELIQLSIP